MKTRQTLHWFFFPKSFSFYICTKNEPINVESHMQGRNQEIILAKQSHWVGIICPFPVEIGLTIPKIRVRQMLGCLTIDYAPGMYVKCPCLSTRRRGDKLDPNRCWIPLYRQTFLNAYISFHHYRMKLWPFFSLVLDNIKN